MCAGSGYLGGYIRDNESKCDGLRESMATWEQIICTISKTAGKYPQDSYAVVVRAIQSEWIFLQHAIWDMGDASTGVDKMIQGKFLPCLFF